MGWPMRRPFSWLRATVAGFVVLAAVPDAARAQAKVNRDPKEKPEVKRLTLRGVTAVDRIELERSIETQSTSCRNLLVTPICLLSHAPLWVDRKYLDRAEMAKDIIRIRVYY